MNSNNTPAFMHEPFSKLWIVLYPAPLFVLNQKTILEDTNKCASSPSG